MSAETTMIVNELSSTTSTKTTMTNVATNVLDLARGSVEGMIVLLEYLGEDGWQDLAEGVTDSSGEIKELLRTDSPLTLGIYRLSFNTKSYMEKIGRQVPYPYVPVVFEVTDKRDAYEISLMLSSTGYSSNIELKPPA